MKSMSFLDSFVEQKLLALHTCYLAKVSSVSGSYANIQPLSLIKSVGSNPKKQTVLNNVPICKHTVEYVKKDSTVLVVCCERDITQTRKGSFALPSLRRHSMSDSVIIGVI